jgi:Emfourin
MKIKFRQTGGFAGLSKSIEMEQKSLSKEETATLKSLIEQADYFELPESTPQSAADMEQYLINIEMNGKTREIFVGRKNMPKNLKPLVKHLAKKAKYDKR